MAVSSLWGALSTKVSVLELVLISGTGNLPHLLDATISAPRSAIIRKLVTTRSSFFSFCARLMALCAVEAKSA